jgi:hypothetical protein
MTMSSVTNNLIIVFGQNNSTIDFSEVVLVYAEEIEDHYISHQNSPGIFQSRLC